MSSIFSRIVAGEIPSTKVYEDDLTLAFMDINPISPGHTLVICKDEYPDLFDIPSETLNALAQTSQRVARAIRDALKPDGLNIVQNNGAAAGQEVFHYHVHLIPRWEGDGRIKLYRGESGERSQLEEIAQQIQQRLS